MPTVFRTTQSRLDYLEIWEYIAKDNPVAADGLVDLLDVHLETLLKSPGIGRLRAELFPALRSFPVDKLHHFLSFRY